MILFALCTVLYSMGIFTVHDFVYLVYGIVLHGSLYCTLSYLPCGRYCTAWQSAQYMILFTLCMVLYCMAVCTVHDLVYLVYGIGLHGSLYCNDLFYLAYGIVLHGSLYFTLSYLPCVRYCTAWQSVLYIILFTLYTVLYCMAVCTSSMEKSGSKITDSSPASSIKYIIIEISSIYRNKLQ